MPSSGDRLEVVNLLKLKSRISQLLPKNRMVRGIGVLVGGTASAQLLAILAAPVLTRLYSPDDFGLLAVFTALLAFFTVIASGRYELTIPLPESDQDAANITFLGFVIVLFTTLLSLILFLIWPHEIAHVLSAPELAGLLWLIPFGVFFVGCYQLFNKWAVRTKSYRHISRTRIYQSLGTLGIQLGAFKIGGSALLVGHATGQGIGATGLALSALRRAEFRHCNWKDMWRQARRYRDFPIYSTWTALFNTASLQLAPVVLVASFGTVIAGLYALTLRVLSIPGSLIGNAVGSVFLSEAPAASRSGSLAELVSTFHSRLAMAGSVPLVILLFFGPELFQLVFGGEWRQAGIYAQWMAPWIYLQFQWSPLSMIASVLELQREALVSQVITFVTRFGALALSVVFAQTPDDTIFAFAVVSAVVYFCRMLWFVKKAQVKVVSVVVADIKYFLTAAILISPVYIAVKMFV